MTAVRIERPEPHVALVTIDRAEARNAVNGEVASALEAFVGASETDDDIRVVVLTGAGHTFCAGADLKEIAAGKVRELVTRDGGFAGFVRAARRKPWIAAVNGPALAGGTEIVLACDMAIAAETASFGLPEVKRGLAALAGGLYRLPRALPRALAMEAIATGDSITAARAAEFGLVNAVVADGEAARAALGLARRIAANAPVAVRESLAIARRAHEDDGELEQASREAGRRLAETEDYREGPRAFIEKRAPRWSGR